MSAALLLACGGSSPASEEPEQPADQATAEKPPGETQEGDEKPPESDDTEQQADPSEGEPVDEPNKDETTAKPADPAKDDEPEEKPDLPHPALFDPNLAIESAPDQFNVRLDTTKGQFMIEVHRDWAPQGADRFYNLVRIGYFKDIAFFRVIQNFMAQFGIHGDPKVNEVWRNANILDDPVVQSNLRGYLSFANTGLPNSRSVQLFINFVNNSRLDASRFSPFGRVVAGMDVVDSLYNGYGEGFPRGRGPDQRQVQARGNAYLKSSFPELDYILSAEIVEE